MTINKYYDNEKDKTHHQSAMQVVARDLGISLSEIGEHYQRALEELRATARVKDFLSILAIRRVRDILRSKRRA